MSTLRVNNLTNQANDGGIDFAVQPVIDGLAKAWVNFNGTSTVAIRASYNVSSITDNGTGDYTVNFTTAMEDANYAPTTLLNGAGGGNVMAPYFNGAPSTASYRIGTRRVDTSNPADTEYVNISIFR
jgi:hypothetical protein